MIALRDMPNTMFATYPDGHEKAGQFIERDAKCACGATFRQTMLSARELEAAERLGVIENIRRQIPTYYVPVFCPPCERADLRRGASIAEARRVASTVPDHRRDIA